MVYVKVFTALLVILPALRTHANNPQVQEAILRCRDKLSEDPTFAKAKNMLGILLEATGELSDLEEVADLSWQAGNCDDLDAHQRVDAMFRAGKSFSQLGTTDRAVESYQRALALAEDQTMAEEILRQVTPLFFRDKVQIATLESATSLSSLASLLVQRFASSPLIHQFQGAVWRKAGNLEESFQSYHTATTLLQSSSVSATESYILAASAARQVGRDLKQQLSYLEMALQETDDDASDDRAEIFDNMGIAYKAAGEKEEAIRCFQSALSVKPGDGHALAQLASLDGPQSATTFDADYVQGLFDGFSSTFEEKLLSLDYEGHKWVADELANRLGGAKDSVPTVIDLGCGTGLLGEAIMRQLSTTPKIVGVDLSPRMVDMARVRILDDGQRIYQEVVQDDAETFLRRLDKASVDAVVAADVFIYIGELEGVLSAVWNALSSSGFLVFSVETTEEGMILLPSGRFGHQKGYIQELAKRTGFDMRWWKEGTLRKQHGAPVQGAVVVLQKKEETY